MVTKAINRIRAIHPPRYRKNLFTDDGSLIGGYEPTPAKHIARVDPSDAIRSAEIVSTIRQYFEIIEFRPYGGGIQHMLFSDIMSNFDAANETDAALLNTIAIFEKLLERTGAIASDLAAIAARPRHTKQRNRFRSA
jgi:hypothetical protein